MEAGCDAIYWSQGHGCGNFFGGHLQGDDDSTGQVEYYEFSIHGGRVPGPGRRRGVDRLPPVRLPQRHHLRERRRARLAHGRQRLRRGRADERRRVRHRHHPQRPHFGPDDDDQRRVRPDGRLHVDVRRLRLRLRADARRAQRLLALHAAIQPGVLPRVRRLGGRLRPRHGRPGHGAGQRAAALRGDDGPDAHLRRDPRSAGRHVVGEHGGGVDPGRVHVHRRLARGRLRLRGGTLGQDGSCHERRPNDRAAGHRHQYDW